METAWRARARKQNTHAAITICLYLKRKKKRDGFVDRKLVWKESRR